VCESKRVREETCILLTTRKSCESRWMCVWGVWRECLRTDASLVCENR